MYGDLSTWLSLPDEGTLPTRKFIGDDDIIVFNKAKPGSRRLKGNNVKPLLVALVTDSMNVVSSSDTLNYREKKLDVESDLDESYDFSHQLSAFSYYSESTDVATSGSVNTADKKQKLGEKKNLASRKCVSCPEAAILDDSICSSSSEKKVNRLSRSLEVTLTGHYRDDDHPVDIGIGTTTLDTATDFDGSFRQRTATSNSNSSASSIAFFTEEDAVLYPDDDCSRISYVSVYRGSPVPFENTETEETAASLNIVPNDSVRLTYSDVETATDETAASLTILSQESVRLTYCAPAPSPFRNKLRRMPQRGCKTCILDGLKNHPACPSSVFHKSSKDNRSANTWTNDDEINIIYL